jgi:hypothetical protein
MIRIPVRARRRVIDQDGREIDERPSGLRAAFMLVFRRPDEVQDEGPWRPPNTGPDDVAGVSRMPFTFHRLADWVRAGFAQIDRDRDALAKSFAKGLNRMVDENRARICELEERLERLAARQREWIALENGRVVAGAMTAAYAAGGTDLVEKMTPAVLARMDAQRKALPVGAAL